MKVKEKLHRLINNQRGEIIFGNIPNYAYAGSPEALLDGPLADTQAQDLAPKNKTMTLPTDSKERKNYPLFEGCISYFPAALAGVSNISKLGNDKHNPGEELHHARGKSMDHSDCIIRHLVDLADLLAALQRDGDKPNPADILTEVNQMTWRALAYSQELHEKLGAPLAPKARNACPKK